MRDKLNVMPFPAGAMHYRTGGNEKGRETEIHKVLLSTVFSFNRKNDETKGLRVEGEDKRGSMDVTGRVHVK